MEYSDLWFMVSILIYKIPITNQSYLAQQLDCILQQIVIEVLIQVQQHIHADVFQRKTGY